MNGSRLPDFEVAIVGAGIAGLMLFKKLAGLGVRVLLVERKGSVADGPSTRNEGWLHRGTYHATSIKERQQAVEVARRCVYGYEQIRTYVPEAIEEFGSQAMALLLDHRRHDEIVSRWNEAGVAFEEITCATARKIAPEIRLSDAAAAFTVQDVGINTRILYAKLLNEGIRYGGQFYSNSEFKPHLSNEGRGQLLTPQGPIDIAARLIVYTCGYAVRDLLLRQHSLDIPIRYWKSHLLITPRLSRPSVFCVDPGEAAMMNHGEFSIVGLNEDAQLCAVPDFDPIPTNITAIHSAVSRLFPSADLTDLLPIACIKTDFLDPNRPSRSLNIGILEPKPGLICALPGKMTESPFLTDRLVSLIFDRLDATGVTLRPVDQLSKARNPEPLYCYSSRDNISN